MWQLHLMSPPAVFAPSAKEAFLSCVRGKAVLKAVPSLNILRFRGGRCWNGGDGAFAPGGLNFAAGAMAEPLACALNGVEDCRLRLGDTLLIVGAGPMGLLAAQSALAQGVGTVIMSEYNPARLAKARKIGALAVNPRQENLKEIIREETNGLMAQAVMVCVGGAQAVEEAQQYAAPGAVINMFGGLPKDSKVIIDPGLIHYQQVSLVGSFGFTHIQFRRALELMGGKRINVAQIITHTLPLERAEEGINLSIEQEALKVMLTNEV